MSGRNGRYAGSHQNCCTNYTANSDARTNPNSDREPITNYFQKEHAFFYAICDVWGVKAAGSIENQPVLSDVPTLVLAGELDPATPTTWGRQVAGQLANATFVEFPGLGHNLFAEHSCAREIIADYLLDPDMPPNLSCIEAIQHKFAVP